MNPKVNGPNSVSMKCGVWQFDENVEMSVMSDGSTHFKLKSIAELPECSLV